MSEESIQACPVCGQQQRQITHPALGGWISYVGVEAEMRDEAIRQRDELRALVEPLLADPWRDDGERYHRCVFCGGQAPLHTTEDCPAWTPNRDRLLGRDRAPAPPEAT